MTIILYFDSSARIVSRSIPEIVQYSEVDILAYLPYDSSERVFSFSLVRPDGYKANEVYFSCGDEVEDGIFEWSAKIRPYHTLVMPGTESTKQMMLGFTLKHIVEGLVQSIKSSPILKLSVIRSVEPAPNEIEAEIADDFENRISTLELIGAVGGSHEGLTYSSRALPNQHPISAITGLKQEIGVFVGEDEPEEGEKTWFEPVDIIGDTSGWTTMVSNPTISDGAIFYYSPTGINLNRLVVVGQVNGDYITQELYNVGNLISGEVIIYAESDPFQTQSVYIELRLYQTYAEVKAFHNTGAIFITNFTALRLEVYD